LNELLNDDWSNLDLVAKLAFSIIVPISRGELLCTMNFDFLRIGRWIFTAMKEQAA
jgi:hypothetical protein